jgi:hypothetical protein
LKAQRRNERKQSGGTLDAIGLTAAGEKITADVTYTKTIHTYAKIMYQLRKSLHLFIYKFFGRGYIFVTKFNLKFSLLLT